MLLTLATIEQDCIPMPQLVLPPRDILGVEAGDRYDPAVFFSLRKYRFGTGGLTQSLRGDFPNDFFGTQADRLDLILKIRLFRWLHTVQCNYPLVIPKPAKGDAPPFKIVRADRMLTVVLRGRPDRPHLHAVFLDDNRFKAAAEFLAQKGVSCERAHPEGFSKLELSNAAQCYQWLQRWGDIRTLCGGAQALGQCLVQYAHDARGGCKDAEAMLQHPVSTLMPQIANILRIDEDTAYVHLAAAIIFRFVTLDAKKPCAVTAPLALMEEQNHVH
ncbi:hypothetical protein [Cupriavidus necator]